MIFGGNSARLYKYGAKELLIVHAQGCLESCL
jgi:hypothetical protein